MFTKDQQRTVNETPIKEGQDYLVGSYSNKKLLEAGLAVFALLDEEGLSESDFEVTYILKSNFNDSYVDCRPDKAFLYFQRRAHRYKAQKKQRAAGVLT